MRRIFVRFQRFRSIRIKEIVSANANKRVLQYVSTSAKRFGRRDFLLWYLLDKFIRTNGATKSLKNGLQSLLKFNPGGSLF